MNLAHWTSSAWWGADLRAVEEAYPNARFYQRRNAHGESVALWNVIMDPIPNPEDAPLILADLEEGKPVNIGPHGKVRHSRNCEIDLEEHSRNLPLVRLTVRDFSVELEYPAQRLEQAGPVHPKLRILSPEISLRTHPHHPHLFYDQVTRNSWACPISAQDTTWQWELGATVKYLDHCAIWLLKTEVWATTGGSVLPALGRWVGPATSHQPHTVLRETYLEGPCRCGRGQIYRDCCFVRDVGAAFLRS